MYLMYPTVYKFCPFNYILRERERERERERGIKLCLKTMAVAPAWFMASAARQAVTVWM